MQQSMAYRNRFPTRLQVGAIAGRHFCSNVFYVCDNLRQFDFDICVAGPLQWLPLPKELSCPLAFLRPTRSLKLHAVIRCLPGLPYSPQCRSRP